MNDKIKNAAGDLEKWLSDPHELGHKPNKIKFTTEFEDEDGIYCMVFKFKPTLFSKWCLGIVSESGTFSEMQEYKKETEIQDATDILNMLKEYWKSLAKESEQQSNS